MKEGKWIITDTKPALHLKAQKLNQLKHNQIERVLGVYINLALKWRDQYKVMREKLIISIIKLLATDMNSFQTHMYFNMYITRIVFFGCGIIDLSVS